MEAELLRLWNLVSEITEQLNQNKLATERLQQHAEHLNEQAGKVSDGATLRRFNTDLSKEIFTSELERLSAALIMENQSLLHENKQLNSLLDDYERTLGTVMEKFRGHSQAAQTHELTLIRHYETLLTQERMEDESAILALDAEYFSNLKTLIAATMRSMEGTKTPPPEDPAENIEDQEEPQEEGGDDEVSDRPQDMGDWAEERESEIQRLERENAEMRHLLGISPAQGREYGIEDDDIPPSPKWNRRSFSVPRSNSGSALRDDRLKGNGRPGQNRRPGEQRKTNMFGRGVFEAEFSPGVGGPERVPSPPNDMPWTGETAVEAALNTRDISLT